MHEGYPWHLVALAYWVPAMFVFAVGACVGSLVNVLVYRLPRGMPVVVPSSRCTNCQTKLTWRENIPILGWLALRGRCRFCKSPISAEYPIVETVVALLFLGAYVICYLPFVQGDGLDLAAIGAIQPEWARNGPARTWPVFAAGLVLLACLVAMTLVDFKTYTIPLVLTWVPVGAAVVLHPVNALLVGAGGLRYTAGTLGDWAIAAPGPAGWWWAGAAVGGVVGVLVASVMLARGWIGRSFAEYHEWESKAIEDWKRDHPEADGPKADTPDMWVRYPHARREMVRELAFLAAPVALAWLGGIAAERLAGDVSMPLWAQALTAVAMGYLIGAALVWGVRIFGTLLFGKEAMGLGDVHVLAAIGACLGWVDAVAAFFAAVLVGLFAAIGAALASRSARMLAFGPCLAIGAVVVLLAKPLIEAALSALVRAEVPINLP
jgi:leader peptidase (prepilin peptidase)/N-methyltransferase